VIYVFLCSPVPASARDENEKNNAKFEGLRASRNDEEKGRKGGDGGGGWLVEKE